MRTEEIMIPMRDGMHLQNSLYLPPGDGPFPALLARCMYGADRVAETAKFWTGKGYAVLLQNIRGRHGSEGGPVVRARFRNGLDNPALIKRGEVYRYEIDLWSTSNVFLLGHSIALAISSSNFPRINRNLNTGGDNEQDSDFITEDQTVFHNSRYSSHLILPVIEFPGQIFHE